MFQYEIALDQVFTWIPLLLRWGLIENVFYLYSPISRCRNNVLVIEVYNIDGSPVSDQHPPEGDVGWGGHIPYSNGTVFGAGHHHAIIETQVQNCFTMVNQSV